MVLIPEQNSKSYKLGTIIIGILQSVGAFVSLVLAAAYAEHPNEFIELFPATRPFIDDLKYIFIMISVLSAIHCVVSILLIFGAEMKRSQLLKPWLIYSPVFIIAYVTIALIVAVQYSNISNAFATFIILAIGIKMIGFMTFFTYVVHKHYKYLIRLNF